MKILINAITRFFITIHLNITDLAKKTTHGIFICNHQSFLDGILLGISLPQKPLFVIDRTIANRWYFKVFLKYINHVTIDTHHPMAIKTLIREVGNGRSIVIFPEGRITITGSFMKFYEGSAFIAYRTNVPLIPVYLDGAEFTYFSRLKNLVKRRLFADITITVKDPIYINPPKELKGRNLRQYLAQYTQELFLNFRVDQYQPASLFDSFLNARYKFGSHKVCVEDIERRPLTYNQLLKRSLAITSLLKKHTQESERVGVLLPNSVSTAAIIIGLSAGQRIPAMLNYTSGVRNMEVSLIAANIKTIFTSKKFIEKGKLTHLVEAFPHINWLYAEDIAPTLTLKNKLWILGAYYFPKNYLPIQNPDDEAIVLFTSGSEGHPKGVVHSHRSLLINVEQLKTVADFTMQDTFMVTLPLFHAFGLTAGLLLPLMSGSKAFLYVSPLHYRIIPELIYDIQATILFGTSTFLLNYAKRGNPFDFASLRYVVAGAERVSEEAKNLWSEKIGCRILEGYGVTECAPVISINVPMNFKKNSVGKVLPSIETRIIPVEGVDNGGKLIVKGKNVMKGYLLYEQPNKIIPPHFDNIEGWYDTGDVVSMDEAGFITIQGRSKRFAKIAGEMISLEVVEKLLHSTYPEAQHAAVIKQDTHRGESIVLFSTQKAIKRSEILKTARELGINELAIPKQIEYLPKIPLLGSGKIDYTTLTNPLKEC